jgi:hypothetical protein
MGPHRKLGIYVGYQSPSIIKYLEPLTGDLFTARYADCIFSENHFSALWGEIIPHKQCQEINLDAIAISNHDPRTSESELQVQKIINLQHIANNTPDAFIDYKDVTKSYNPTRNMPARVEVSNKTTQLPCKRGRCTTIPTDASPSKQKKRKTKSSKIVNVTQNHVEKHSVEVQPSHPTSTVHSINDVGTSECPDATIFRNDDASERVHEISINYLKFGESYDRKTIIVDVDFSVMIAQLIQNDPNPKTMAECKSCSDCNQWKEAIQAEITSLSKRKVFSQAMPTPPKVFPVGFKWVFIRKQNENNEVVRYKARLVAQGFT